MGHITFKWVPKSFLEMKWTLIFFFLFASHANRVVDEFSGRSYETMEVVGPQMVLTMKMFVFAWNISDGRRKVEVRLSAFVYKNQKVA